ncbi:YkgJ family cysteine cluster protein [Cupriavidus sp. TMH.W2]|uniref:YkgJ family cysteine cluster protein n=1 Tax=Cupriavidus sp. TMH.W2 TaxID=3434465 RepID=UPI003D776CC9
MPSPANPNQIIAQNLAPVADQLMRADTGKVYIALKPVFTAMDTAMAASPTAVDCKAGCDYCCHYHVQVSAAEAFALAEHIAGLPAAEQTAIRDRLAASVERIGPLSHAQYHATNIPCAFLQDGRCSVYAARPTACRGYHAVAVQACAAAFARPEAPPMRRLDPVRDAVQKGYWSTMLLGHEHAGRDTMVYELQAAVLAALTNRAAFRRWKEGKVAFPEVRDRRGLRALMAEATP